MRTKPFSIVSPSRDPFSCTSSQAKESIIKFGFLFIHNMSSVDGKLVGKEADLQSDQCDKAPKPSKPPWRWMGSAVDGAVCETAKVKNNLCARCQMIFDILTQVLLCWDSSPSMWSAAQFKDVRRRRMPLRGFLVNFGSLSLSETAACDFCAFVIRIVYTTMEKDMPELQKEIVVLLSTNNIGKVQPKPDFDIAHDDTIVWRKALSFGFYDVKFAAMLPPPGTVFLSDEFIPESLDDYFLASVQNIARLIDIDGVETRRINGHRTDAAKSDIRLGSARLRPALCDPDKFATWLLACTELHGGKCNKYKRRIQQPIRLLNTSTLHLQTFGPNSMPRYFTLSYVWGIKKYTCLEENNFSKVINLGFSHDANFNPSISDAIALMKGMNETYLWVDALCIVQDRDDDKLAQIYQMDSIYANSILTIVAAGDNQGGLPGISKPRTEISTVQAGALMLVADACASSESHWSDNTAWSSRAWTLQEYLVSHRKLVFTTDQVYWWCQGSSWCESIHLASRTHRYEAKMPEQDMPLTDMHTLPLKKFATKSEADYLSKFSEVVEQYSGRKVTEQADRLFAFQGILNTIKAIDPRKDYFWALTTWVFEIELDWRDEFNRSSKGEFSPVTDYIFPSWSWLSYPGAIAMRSTNAVIVCFRFFYDSATADLDCKRVSSMKYQSPPATDNSNRSVDVSMIKIRAQFPGVTFNPDRQIVFWADVVRLGVNWNEELDFSNGRLLTGYDEGLLDRPELKDSCSLLSWSEEIIKTKTEYDFISINCEFCGDKRLRSIWMLNWKNGIALRAGHGIIQSRIWNSITKNRRLIILE